MSSRPSESPGLEMFAGFGKAGSDLRGFEEVGLSSESNRRSEACRQWSWG